MKRGLGPALLGSVAFHAAVAALMLWQWPEARQQMLGSAVPVTIVSSIPQAAPAPAPAEAPVEPEPAVEEAPAAEPPPPAPPTPQPPKPQPKPAPAPIRKAEAPKPPPAKASQTPPPKRRSEESSLDLAALEASLKKSKAARPPASSPKAAQGSAPAGQLSPAGQAAIGELARRIQDEWDLNCEIAGEVDVKVSFTLNSAGRIVSGPRLLEQRSGAAWQTAARSAISAVKAAEPYSGLPSELYNVELRPNLRASQVCSGA